MHKMLVTQICVFRVCPSPNALFGKKVKSSDKSYPDRTMILMEQFRNQLEVTISTN